MRRQTGLKRSMIRV